MVAVLKILTGEFRHMETSGSRNHSTSQANSALDRKDWTRTSKQSNGYCSMRESTIG